MRRPTILRQAMEKAQVMPTFNATERNPLFRQLRHAVRSNLGYVSPKRG